MKVTYLFLFLCLLGLEMGFAKTTYHKATAQKGDGALSLLRRYSLADYDCNVDEFYDLNKLRDGAALVVGKEYFIPILLYDFDGNTIRSTLNIKDIEKAKRIESFNDKMLIQGHRRETYLKSKILWVPHHELKCEEEKEKEDNPVKKPNADKGKLSTGARMYAIFGEHYAFVPLKDRTLKNKVFYIDAGHGGPDPGCMAKFNGHTICEDEYAYDVSLRLARNLISHGAIVYLITRDPNDGIRDTEYLKCDKDEQCWDNTTIPYGQKERLTQRSDAVNELYHKHLKQGIKHQRVVIIHIDSQPKSESEDVFFYHKPDDAAGEKLARQMHATLKSKYKRPYLGKVSSRELFLLMNCEPTSVFIELGNIQNPNDQKRVTIPENRQTMADWLYEGLLR
ncbi:MAG: N-acetylmuramoyl-L-alanine amidase [Bacteroidia bacterium]